MMYSFNFENVIKNISENLRKFIFGNYYKQISFTREDIYHSLEKKNGKI